MKDFRDKVVVITGGASGIGFSFAKQFGQEGARVLIADLGAERIDRAVAELKQLGIDAAGRECDVSEREQVEALADHAWTTYGRVDAILNNAGIGGRRFPVIEAPREAIDEVFGVNLFGVWNGVSVFGKRLIEQGTPAVILNTGSENSFFNAVPQNSAYLASKHAVFAMTEALREEVPEFIQVGLIIPGYVKTEMTKGAPGGMDVDRFTSICMEQIKAGEFYIVSHAYNIVRIEARQKEIAGAYAKYAPRYEGDDEFDVRSLIARLTKRG